MNDSPDLSTSDLTQRALALLARRTVLSGNGPPGLKQSHPALFASAARRGVAALDRLSKIDDITLIRPQRSRFCEPGSSLDRLAALVLAITYGEMIELAAGLWGSRGTKGERPIAQANLAATLHRWATEKRQ
jgi:hypothetical protein